MHEQIVSVNLTLPANGLSALPGLPFINLRCPVCGFEYQKAGDPETVMGSDNYEAGWGGRGDLLRIPFKGECGSVWYFCFGFHKGETAVFVQIETSCQD